MLKIPGCSHIVLITSLLTSLLSSYILIPCQSLSISDHVTYFPKSKRSFASGASSHPIQRYYLVTRSYEETLNSVKTPTGTYAKKTSPLSQTQKLENNFLHSNSAQCLNCTQHVNKVSNETQTSRTLIPLALPSFQTKTNSGNFNHVDFSEIRREKEPLYNFYFRNSSLTKHYLNTTRPRSKFLFSAFSQESKQSRAQDECIENCDRNKSKTNTTGNFKLFSKNISNATMVPFAHSTRDQHTTQQQVQPESRRNDKFLEADSKTEALSFQPLSSFSDSFNISQEKSTNLATNGKLINKTKPNVFKNLQRALKAKLDAVTKFEEQPLPQSIESKEMFFNKKGSKRKEGVTPNVFKNIAKPLNKLKTATQKINGSDHIVLNLNELKRLKPVKYENGQLILQVSKDTTDADEGFSEEDSEENTSGDSGETYWTPTLEVLSSLGVEEDFILPISAIGDVLVPTVFSAAEQRVQQSIKKMPSKPSLPSLSPLPQNQPCAETADSDLIGTHFSPLANKKPTISRGSFKPLANSTTAAPTTVTTKKPNNITQKPNSVTQKPTTIKTTAKPQKQEPTKTKTTKPNTTQKPDISTTPISLSSSTKDPEVIRLVKKMVKQQEQSYLPTGVLSGAVLELIGHILKFTSSIINIFKTVEGAFLPLGSISEFILPLINQNQKSSNQETALDFENNNQLES